MIMGDAAGGSWEGGEYVPSGIITEKDAQHAALRGNNNEIIISPGDHVAALTVLFPSSLCCAGCECLFLAHFSLSIRSLIVQKINTNAIVLHFACLFPLRRPWIADCVSRRRWERCIQQRAIEAIQE
jgi:hypothetical protein